MFIHTHFMYIFVSHILLMETDRYKLLVDNGSSKIHTNYEQLFKNKLSNIKVTITSNVILTV